MVLRVHVKQTVFDTLGGGLCAEALAAQPMLGGAAALAEPSAQSVSLGRFDIWKALGSLRGSAALCPALSGCGVFPQRFGGGRGSGGGGSPRRATRGLALRGGLSGMCRVGGR